MSNIKRMLREPDDLAFVVELIAALFGFFGIGHMLRGRIALGILLLIFGWVWGGISAFAASSTGGLSAICTCPIHIALALGSAFLAR